MSYVKGRRSHISLPRQSVGIIVIRVIHQLCVLHASMSRLLFSITCYVIQQLAWWMDAPISEAINVQTPAVLDILRLPGPLLCDANVRVPCATLRTSGRDAYRAYSTRTRTRSSGSTDAFCRKHSRSFALFSFAFVIGNLDVICK